MRRKSIILIALLVLCLSGPVTAQEIGQIKKVNGNVLVERAGQQLPGAAGMKVQMADKIKTGKDGSVGITLTDNTMLSAGPGSVLILSKYAFDSTTHQGEFDATMNRGTLSMVSGKLAKQSPQAVRVKTPAAILGIRGTEFFVSVEGEDND